MPLIQARCLTIQIDAILVAKIGDSARFECVAWTCCFLNLTLRRQSARTLHEAGEAPGNCSSIKKTNADAAASDAYEYKYQRIRTVQMAAGCHEEGSNKLKMISLLCSDCQDLLCPDNYFCSEQFVLLSCHDCRLVI